jgi:hypothetical protein
MLITRVANVDITWHKDVVTSPRVSHEFDLTLEDKSVLRAIEQLNFIQMKRKCFSVLSTLLQKWYVMLYTCWVPPGESASGFHWYEIVWAPELVST